VPRALPLLALLLAADPPGAAAQRHWSSSFAPYAYFSTVDGLWLAGHVKRYSPVGVEERPEPDRAWIQLTAGASTAGSRLARLDAAAPGWWDGWRVRVTLGARRHNRFPYFGLGNDSRFAADSVGDDRPFFYQVSRSTLGARLTVQRRVAGPLRALVGAGVERTGFRELPGDNVFRRDHAAGVVDSGTVPFSDAVLRVGLVLDTRDHEIDPHHGVLLETVYVTGRGYGRATGWAHAWVQPVARVWLAARVGGERMTGAVPLAAQTTMEASEDALIALGGYRSLRGYPDARFTGPTKLLGSLEARWALLWVPSLFELKLGLFYDTGRVFAPGEAFRLTTDGLHHGWGGEVGLRVGRNGLLVVGAGFGREGWELLFDTGWAF
jgi:outer membrane protein assembly factor BamA